MSTPLHGLEADGERQAVQAALGDEYEVQRLLGRGGMGSVYLAHERSLDREVAVKVLHPASVTGDVRDRFLREARTAARLTHPNIVPLHSFGHAGEMLYYVMGYVDGESLESRLRSHPRLEPEEARRVLLELTDALDYAHRRGVVHRDIKPDNVLLEHGSGRAILTDFGIAKLRHARSSLTELGMIVGTPHYMSPEQAAGDRALDGRSDLYSLGVLGYRMLTGGLPFDAPSVQALLAQHVAKAPRSIVEVAPDVPVALSTAVERCLGKVPSERWPDAAAMRQALEAAEAEWTLPRAAERLPGLGVKLVSGLGGSLLVLEALYVATRELYWGRIALAMPVVAVAIAVPYVLVARRAGISSSRTGRLLFAPPRGWSGWWPRPLRRPGDVWERLPNLVRRARAVTSMTAVIEVFLALPLFLFAIVRASGHGDSRALSRVLAAGSLVAAALVAVVVLHRLRVLRWARRMGIDRRTAARMLAERTWRSTFWHRADVAPLLTTSSRHAVQQAARISFAELARSVVALADQTAEADAPLAAMARAAGMALAGAVERLDREIHVASRDVDHAEIRRLGERLARLEASTNPGTPGKRQMRELITRQIALMRQLADRHDALVMRRDILADHLCALERRLTELRVGAVAGHSSERRSMALREVVLEIQSITTTADGESVPGRVER